MNPNTIVNNTGKEINYKKLLVKFGCYSVDEKIIAKMEQLTNALVHRFIRRGIFYAHRDFDAILNAAEKHE